MLRLLFGCALLVCGCASSQRVPVREPDSFELQQAGQGCYGYELLNHGKRVWYHEFRAELMYSSVSASGSACAVTYNFGKEGHTEYCQDGHASEIIVTVFSPSGEVLNDRRFPREINMPPHWVPPQSCRGVLYLASSDCWLVQLQDAKWPCCQVTWLLLDSRRGTARAEFELTEQLSGKLSDKDMGFPYAEVREIEGTPCVLVVWQPGSMGVRKQGDGASPSDPQMWSPHMSVVTVDGSLLLDLVAGSRESPAPMASTSRLALAKISSRDVELRYRTLGSSSETTSTLHLELEQDSAGRWSCGIRSPGH
jgi:hypothetical protein